MPSNDRRDSAGGWDSASRPGQSSPLASGSSADQADRQRKSSVASSQSLLYRSNPPPAPPSDFNPPPDLAFEEPLHGIQPPSDLPDPFAAAANSPRPQSETSPTSVSPVTTAPSPTTSTSTPPIPPADAHPKALPQRPQIRAIQRLSSESVSRSRALSGASSTQSSDSGDILAARRDELVSHILSDGGESSRRTSAGSTSPGTEPERYPGVNTPTPTASSVNVGDLALAVEDTELSSSPSYAWAEDWTIPRERSGSADEQAHAWDSVWPMANSPHVNLPEASVSRLPMAPVSPYVTPSFSQLVVQRKPSPPAQGAFDRPQSPRTHSEGVHSDRLHLASSTGRASTGGLHIHPHPLAHTFIPGSATENASRSSPIPSSSSNSTGRRSKPGSPALDLEEWIASTPRVLSVERTSHTLTRRPSSSLLAAPAGGLPPRRLSETALGRRPNVPSRRNSPASLVNELPLQEPGAGVGTPPPQKRPPLSQRSKSAQDTRSGTMAAAVAAHRIPDLPTFEQLHARSDGLTLSPLNMEETARFAMTPLSTSPDPPAPPTPPARSPPPPHLPDESPFEDDDDEEEDDTYRTASGQTTPTGPHVTFPASGHALAPSEFPLHDDMSTSNNILVDEGDLLPQEGNVMAEMDVAFDDEGLTTLERIFLLSRSEYAFHRAYVARVLGDLLGDVDPCESVEYVLPLISGFSLDDDDTVKEAFAADLHRILWYFFTTCQLAPGEDAFRHTDDDEAPLLQPLTSQPLQHEEEEYFAGAISIPQSLKLHADSRPNDEQNYSSGSSEYHRDSGHSNSISSSDNLSSQGGLYSNLLGSQASEVGSPGTTVSGFTSEGVPTSKPWRTAVQEVTQEDIDQAEIVNAPVLAVDFFRPLLGTLLLSQNPAIADPVRNGIVAVIARLRGKAPTVDVWGAKAEEQETESSHTYLAQTGHHRHNLMPFTKEARDLVERELLWGIVLGMGALSTDIPDALLDSMFEGHDEADPDCIAHRAHEEELYREQMQHEATLGRALSLSFISHISELYNPDEITEYGFINEVIRGQDGDPTTRAEAAVAMSNVSKSAATEEIARLLPVFNMFVNDADDNVRQSACVTFPSLCKRIVDNDERRSFAIDTVATLLSSSEQVQYALLEVLGEVIYTFAEDSFGPPEQLLQAYCDDSKSTGNDCEWDLLASYNFPGVCLTLGSSRWLELRGLFKRLVDRAGERVVRTITAFIHELAQILTPDQVAEDILPVYRQCLDGPDDVRERMFEHVDVLFANLPQNLAWESFQQISEGWTNDTLGGWRAREQLALQIPSFLSTFRTMEEVGIVLGVMRLALLDPFAAVRDAATYAVPRSYEILLDSACSANKLHDMLLALAQSAQYRQRLTFVRCLREFIRPPPNRKAFEVFFIPALPRLSTDIVDIRLGLARAIADLFIVGAFYGDRVVPVPDVIKRLAFGLSTDASADVREVISNIGVDRWGDVDSDGESISAREALHDEMKHSPNPEAMATAINEALEGSAENIRSVKLPLHARADRPSPPLDPGPESRDPEERAMGNNEFLEGAAPQPDPFAEELGAAESGAGDEVPGGTD